jgi:hypothetical protein
MPIMSRGTDGFAPRLSIDTGDAADGDGRSPGRTATIRLALDARTPERLDALRTVRRAMIREEWTRGLEEGEPSLLDADFSRSGILWEVAPGQVPRGRVKLGALVRRANELLKPEREAARMAAFQARI